MTRFSEIYYYFAMAIEPKRGRPKKRWLDDLTDDMRENGLTIKDAQDHAKWTEKSPRAPKRSSRTGIMLK